MECIRMIFPKLFLSTPSARRATITLHNNPQNYIISIHALREEGDFFVPDRAVRPVLFLSTPSARRATQEAPVKFSTQKDFYPRPPRGGRLGTLQCHYSQFSISIHALREEGDDVLEIALHKGVISIHALREEGDPRRPARSPSSCNFYPRPPRGGRPELRSKVERRRPISIHALREEGDDAPAPRPCLPMNFYPRPPRGGRPSTTGKEDTPQ